MNTHRSRWTSRILIGAATSLFLTCLVNDLSAHGRRNGRPQGNNNNNNSNRNVTPSTGGTRSGHGRLAPSGAYGVQPRRTFVPTGLPGIAGTSVSGPGAASAGGGSLSVRNSASGGNAGDDGNGGGGGSSGNISSGSNGGSGSDSPGSFVGSDGGISGISGNASGGGISGDSSGGGSVVGQTGGVAGSSGDSGNTATGTFLLIAGIVAAIASFGILLLVRSKKRREESEANPTTVESQLVQST